MLLTKIGRKICCSGNFLATNVYILWAQKYCAVAKFHVYGYIINMEKTNDKLKIARSNQRRKYDNSYNIFNQYIQDNIQKHTEKNMNLLQFMELIVNQVELFTNQSQRLVVLSNIHIHTSTAFAQIILEIQLAWHTLNKYEMSIL